MGRLALDTAPAGKGPTLRLSAEGSWRPLLDGDRLTRYSFPCKEPIARTTGQGAELEPPPERRACCNWVLDHLHRGVGALSVGKTWKNRKEHRFAPQRIEQFRCRHCGRFVGPVPSGGLHRNHCPFCLYSRHVDADRSGDRASTCGGSMAPIGVFTRPKGEHVIVHRCLSCGFERYNRIAADDDFDLVLSLPAVEPRGRRRESEK